MAMQYDSRDPPLTPTTTSPLGDLIVLSARLSLSQLHQHRKQRFLAPSPVTTSPLPSILLPIIHILDYLSTIRTARSSLVMLSDAFTKAQIRAAVIPRLTGAEEADLGVIGGILTGEEETNKLGGTLSLEVQGW